MIVFWPAGLKHWIIGPLVTLTDKILKGACHAHFQLYIISTRAVLPDLKVN